MDGYGKVFKSIMRNPELTVEARGIYAYFCSIAGADDSCYPSLDTVLHDLTALQGSLPSVYPANCILTLLTWTNRQA